MKFLARLSKFTITNIKVASRFRSSAPAVLLGSKRVFSTNKLLGCMLWASALTLSVAGCTAESEEPKNQAAGSHNGGQEESPEEEGEDDDNEEDSEEESDEEDAPPKPVVEILLEEVQSSSEDDEKWEEDKRKCSFCKHFLSSPCSTQFKHWSKCVDLAKSRGLDFVGSCKVFTKELMQCTSDNAEYFSQKRDEERAQSELEAVDEERNEDGYRE